MASNAPWQQTGAETPAGRPHPSQLVPAHIIPPSSWTPWNKALTPKTSFEAAGSSTTQKPMTPSPERQSPSVIAQCLPLIEDAFNSQPGVEAQDLGLSTPQICTWIEENRRNEVEKITPKRFRTGVSNALSANSDGKGKGFVKYGEGKKVRWGLPRSENASSLRSPETPIDVNSGTTQTTQSGKRRATGTLAENTATRVRREPSIEKAHQPIPVPPESVLTSLIISSDDIGSPEGSNRETQNEGTPPDTTLRTQRPAIAGSHNEAEQRQGPEKISQFANSLTELQNLGHRFEVLQKAIEEEQKDLPSLDQLSKQVQELEAQARTARQRLGIAHSKAKKIAETEEESRRIQQQMDKVCKKLYIGGSLELAVVGKTTSKPI